MNILSKRIAQTISVLSFIFLALLFWLYDPRRDSIFIALTVFLVMNIVVSIVHILSVCAPKKKKLFELGYRAFYWLLMAYCILFAISMMLYHFESSRTLVFFIIVSLMNIIIVIQMCTKEFKVNKIIIYVILLEIILIFLLLTLSQRFASAYYAGASDAFFHEYIVKKIILTNAISHDVVLYYGDFPGWHLFISIISLISGINVKHSLVITIISLIISLLVFYALGYRMSGQKSVGVFSCVILANSQHFLEWGTILTTSAFTFGLVCLIMYFILVRKHRFSNTLIIILLLLSIIVIHHFTTIVTIVFLVLLALGEWLFRKKNKLRNVTDYNIFGYLKIFIVSSFFYWMYIGESFFEGIVKYLDFILRSFLKDSNMGTLLLVKSFHVNLYNRLLLQMSDIILYGMMLYGIFYIVSNINHIKEKIGWVMIVLGSLSFLLGVALPIMLPNTSSVPFHRLAFYALIFISPLVAYSISSLIKSKLGVLVVVFTVMIFSILSATEAAVDTLPLHTNKKGIMSNQLSSADVECFSFIQDKVAGHILADLVSEYYMHYIQGMDNVSSNVSEINDFLVVKTNELNDRGLLFRKGYGIDQMRIYIDNSNIDQILWNNNNILLYNSNSEKVLRRL